jgi:hypothetical protein
MVDLAKHQLHTFTSSLTDCDMRYSIAFLGLIATATATIYPCQTAIQCFLSPLAKEPAAIKFCAAKYPSTDELVKSTSDIKSSNLYVYSQIT